MRSQLLLRWTVLLGIMHSIVWAQRTGIGIDSPMARFHYMVLPGITDPVWLVTYGNNPFITLTPEPQIGY